MLESELKSRNDKLDKCTEAVINGLHQHVPQIAGPATTTELKHYPSVRARLVDTS